MTPSTHADASDVVFKLFTKEQTVGLLHEVEIYKALENSQGLFIPFFYGIFDSPSWSGYILALEKRYGYTLHEFQSLFDKKDAAEKKIVFEDCWNALKRLHGLGISHGDVNPHNIVICSDHVVFIEFENSVMFGAPTISAFPFWFNIPPHFGRADYMLCLGNPQII